MLGELLLRFVDPFFILTTVSLLSRRIPTQKLAQSKIFKFICDYSFISQKPTDEFSHVFLENYGKIFFLELLSLVF